MRFDLESRRGIAVVVASNYAESKQEYLQGTNKDAEEMEQSLEAHNLQVVRLINHAASRSVIIKVLDQLDDYLRKYKGCTKNKVLVFAFSGHGKRGDILITHDNQELTLYGEVITKFVRHKDLKEIPKLFFIDACRGIHGISPTKKGGGDCPSTPDYMVGNTLIASATIAEHCAYDEYGYWMRNLAKNIKKHDKSLSIILDDLTEEVRKATHGDEALQPEYVSRLWGSFRFHLKKETDEDLKAEIERKRHLGTQYTTIPILFIFVLVGILVEVSRRCI